MKTALHILVYLVLEVFSYQSSNFQKFLLPTTVGSMMIPMRDKVELYTVIYITDSGAPAPTVLLRTPYGTKINCFDTRVRNRQ
jgi:predicted acyl esterase